VANVLLGGPGNDSLSGLAGAISPRRHGADRHFQEAKRTTFYSG